MALRCSTSEHPPRVLSSLNLAASSDVIRDIFFWTASSTRIVDRFVSMTTSSWAHGERERHILFNDALNTFYLRLYGVRHIVKDHSDSERGNPLPPHSLLLSINSKGSFIGTIPQTGSEHMEDKLIIKHWLKDLKSGTMYELQQGVS